MYLRKGTITTFGDGIAILRTRIIYEEQDLNLLSLYNLRMVPTIYTEIKHLQKQYGTLNL